MMSRPPRLAALVLEKLLETPDREFILGYLAEEYEEKTRESRARARLWYWRQVVRAIGPMLLRARPARNASQRKERRLESLHRDLSFTFRQLGKHPGFTATVVLTLALGISANTAIFSVVNGTLLQPLPYPEPERLVYLTSQMSRAQISATHLSDPDFWDVQAEVSSLRLAALGETVDLPLTVADRSEGVIVSRTSWNFFDLLGASPLLGRTFTPEDGIPLEDDTFRPRPLVLSYDTWQRWFGSDPNAVGQSVRIMGSRRMSSGSCHPVSNRTFLRSRK